MFYSIWRRIIMIEKILRTFSIIALTSCSLTIANSNAVKDLMFSLYYIPIQDYDKEIERPLREAPNMEKVYQFMREYQITKENTHE